jgi:probable rRNA maturation factor
MAARVERGKYVIVNRQRKHAIDGAELRRFVPQLVRQLDVENRDFAVVFITDAAMRDYNRNYRGYDKSTDVLSFRGDGGCLGDILISSETAYNQARNSGKLSFQSNIHRLIVHGLLHLMGYDHETDNGEMRSIERRLRRKFQC